jgi:hypothetical protein
MTDLFSDQGLAQWPLDALWPQNVDPYTKLEKYSDSQERVPAGSPEGGEFGSGGGADYSSDEYKPFLGGLKPSDFPYGRVPGMVDAYHKMLHPDDPYGWVAAHPERYSTDPKGIRYSLAWTPEQQAQARQSLADVVRTQEPTTRMPLASFKAFLADGTLRNQWETGRSGAATGASRDYSPRRGSAETESLGVPKNAVPGDRPVYGYMAPGDHGDFLHADNPDDVQTAIQYLPGGSKMADDIRANPDNYFIGITPSRYNSNEGEYHDLASRDELAQRLTNISSNPRSMGAAAFVAMEDQETRYYPVGDGHGNLNLDNVVGYANKEYAANSYGDVQLTMNRDILDHSTVTGGDSIDARLMGAPARMVEADDPRVPIGMVSNSIDASGRTRGNYVEVQYETHPTLADVAKVTFSGSSQPSAAIRQQLNDAKIAWAWEPMPKMDRSSATTFSQIVGKP